MVAHIATAQRGLQFYRGAINGYDEVAGEEC
jgi:hypothetical protein